MILGLFGTVTPPTPYGSAFSGLVPFLNNTLRLIFLIAGLYTLLNLIIAGFGFMTAGGDSKAIENAWAKIWQSLVGLIIIVSSFLLAAIFGYLIFHDASAILNPRIYGPGGSNVPPGVFRN
ncbi:MAG: hypothetical protein V1858_01650 [Candidatus Gottesmanbacteria bacterium]